MALDQKQVKKLIEVAQEGSDSIDGGSGVGRVIGFIVVIGVVLLVPVAAGPIMMLFLVMG